MRDLFEDKDRPDWILLMICENGETLQHQLDALAPYRQHFDDRNIVVVTLLPDQLSVEHGDRSCSLTISEFAQKYDLSLDQMSLVLIDKGDRVKWAAPTPTCITDIISAVDEMPLHDKENATRGPAPDRPPVRRLSA
jgi:hypothetical protein